ncbi:25328_t:CDS:2 [Gigaspora margarita]|uniref:25328_t:CDS:1 n=1 Tax=Gigaspora margarita TaxID=4874 RepID=A0ABM8W794_GIGMA|nr:25328_t:CDS:2 [Gigaspora margarita]
MRRKCKEFVDTDSFIEDRVTNLTRTLYAWNNPAFSPEFEGLQSDGTYVNNFILSAIRATLKCLPPRKSTYISSSERKSSISADRKRNRRFGNHEIDGVKLWRETNDGMYWTRKGCKPDKDNSDVHRYYHLYESTIPIQQSDLSVVSKFIETLLII